MSSSRRAGKILWFNELSGYGFVQALSGEEAFVSARDAKRADLDSLRAGDLVSYETRSDPYGKLPRAVNLRLLESPEV
jgi:cold shock CspA family protein